jgi:hypothetical protein
MLVCDKLLFQQCGTDTDRQTDRQTDNFTSPWQKISNMFRTCNTINGVQLAPHKKNRVLKKAKQTEQESGGIHDKGSDCALF